MSKATQGKLAYNEKAKRQKVTYRNQEYSIILLVLRRLLSSEPIGRRTEEDRQVNVGSTINSNALNRESREGGKATKLGRLVGIEVFSSTVSLPFEYPRRTYSRRDLQYFKNLRNIQRMSIVRRRERLKGYQQLFVPSYSRVQNYVWLPSLQTKAREALYRLLLPSLLKLVVYRREQLKGYQQLFVPS